MRASDRAIERCSHALETFMACMDELNAHREKLFRDISADKRSLESETVRVLTHYQFDRSAGAYSLILNRMVWDAEIIIRTIYETSAKIVFIGAHDNSYRSNLISEYWVLLPSIFDRKGAIKAEQAERFSKKYENKEDGARIFRYLQDRKHFDVDPRGNKRFRDEVERRWTFSEIIKELGKKSDHHIQIVGLEALNHMYGMASHLAHASPKAIDLMDDRATRGDDLEDLEAGHICRMLSDIILLGCFSIRFAQRVVDGTQSLAANLNTLIERMSNEIKSIQEQFHRSQDSFYDKS